MDGIRRIAESFWTAFRTRREIETWTEANAADCGFTRAELYEAAGHGAGVADRMAGILASEGAVRRADPRRVFEMARICAACPHRRACARLLRSEDAADRAEAAGFCPNAAEYHSIAEEDRRAA